MERASYTPLVLPSFSSPRLTWNLCGKWLFMPATDLGGSSSASAPAADDNLWHMINVPDFWQPIEWWLFTRTAGASHNFCRREVERCDRYTFDYASTESAWYRLWVQVPDSYRGKRLVVRFDAVASVASVYWNGKHVGSHAGMFGPFECEVTQHVRFGRRNLLAVFVSSGRADVECADEIAALAVTVNVNREMLRSLPRGWYRRGMAGIWQPVSLVVTGQHRISDVHFRPRLDGATVETTVSSAASERVRVKHSIAGSDGRNLYEPRASVPINRGKAVVELRGLRPKLWSPEHPNLYTLKTQLLAGGKTVDEVETTVGFRAFEVRGNRLYLNGKPYFLRGANMPPHGLRPNDAALADRFMEMMHEGNTMVTRFHVAPPSQVWLNAADRYGVGVSIGETWPWVLIGDSEIPGRELVDTWKKEFLEIVRANRNHPSLVLWTISNESHFHTDSDPVRRQEKFRIFSDLARAVRAEDPYTPIVLHSGYSRQPEEEKTIAADELDDGDIDDKHFYFGWYDRAPYQLKVADHVEGDAANRGRPLISQEACTGYPDSDSGHPVESYVRTHFVPQAWVGRHALHSAHPGIFLDNHAEITKECAETIRRDRGVLSGWMLFANCCWFQDVYDAQTISPYPVYWAVRKAYQPVLVSLATANRHFTAGQTFTAEVVVANDDPDRPLLSGLTLKWRIFGKSAAPGTSGETRFPDCRYDSRSRASVEFETPSDLPDERADMTLELGVWQGDELVSRNDYPIVCAASSWWKSDEPATLLVADRDGSVGPYFASLGFHCDRAAAVEWSSLPADQCVVLGPGLGRSQIGDVEGCADFVERGGRVLILEPSLDPKEGVLPQIAKLAVDQIGVKHTAGSFVDVVEPHLLDGINPLGMRRWNASGGEDVRVCRVGYQIPDGPGITRLATHIQPHAYLQPADLTRYSSSPVFAVRRGAGEALVSSLLLADDPIARRFARNLVLYLMRKE
mgnify:CR=1 FL=1